LLRQSVRYCLKSEKNGQQAKYSAEMRALLPKLLDQYKLDGMKLGSRQVDDAWVSKLAEASARGQIGETSALAELSYMTYHLDWTVFLFAHTVSEVLDLLAFILIFSWTVRRAASYRARPTLSPLISNACQRRSSSTFSSAHHASQSMP
jgi:hypothetical protein